MADHEKLLQEGEAALERAAELLAKAADPELDPATADEDPDKDFDGLDNPEPVEGDGNAGEQPDEDGDDDCPEGEDCEKDEEGDEPAGETTEESVPEEGEDEPMAKAADGFVDATPLLEAIDAKLGQLAELTKRVQALEAHNNALVKALVAQNEGLGALVKAHGVLADDTPRRPKSRQVSVPTSAPKLDRETVMAKAAEIVDDPVRMGMIEHYYNIGNIEGMLQHLTAEERAKLAG